MSGAAGARPLCVAYVVNTYPSPSHSFIRREIRALEAQGLVVRRMSVRRGSVNPGSDEEAAELQRTEVLLAAGALGLLWACLLVALQRPRRFAAALRLAWRLGRRADRGRLVHLAYLAEAALLLRRLGGAADLLHAHFGTNSTAVAMLCTALGGPPFGFTVHGPEEFERADGIGLRLKVAHARYVAVISDFCRSQVWRFAEFADWPKAVVVRCGVDAGFLEPPRLPPPAAPELLWVGRLAPEKGLPVLLEACRQLRDRGVAFRVTVVGGGPLEGWLRDGIRAAGLAPHLELAGWQSAAQIRAHMDRCRGLVLSSFAEGLPVVLMEALARERPVIATRIAAVPELVVPGESGWLVPPGRGDLLADAMAELLALPPARVAALGAAGRAKVERWHDAPREAAALAAVMRQVVR